MTRAADFSDFNLNARTRIVYAGPSDIAGLAGQLATQLSKPTGYTIKALPAKVPVTGSIFLSLKNDPSIKEEGYRLTITKSGIELTARKAAGIFYGMQTLLQLLPPHIEMKHEDEPQEWKIPCVTIEDHPRFAWRGLMLDVSRHFFTVAQVKDYIDQMVKYKFNLLHLHLTDDQGWRLQIKSLPRLTEVSWRRAGRSAGSRPPTRGTDADPAPPRPRRRAATCA